MSNQCLNCGAYLTSHKFFCSHCGHNINTHRFTFRGLLHDFLHSFLHADKGLLRLLKGLITRPGHTVAEFIEGKRKTYFNPFTFLALCIGFMVLLNTWMKTYSDLPVPDPKVIANIADEKMRTLYILSIERTARMIEFGNKYLNIISVLISPFFAYFLWLFFRRRKRNMAEITVAYIFFTGFSNVLSTIFISPWLAMFRNTAAASPLLYGSIILQTLYFAWGFKVFFNYRTASGYIKVLLVLWLAGTIGLILFIIGVFYYVYRGGVYDVLKYL